MVPSFESEFKLAGNLRVLSDLGGPPSMPLPTPPVPQPPINRFLTVEEGKGLTQQIEPRKSDGSS